MPPTINYNVRLRTVTLAEFETLALHLGAHFELENRNDGVKRYQCTHCEQWFNGDTSIQSLLIHAQHERRNDCDTCAALEFKPITAA